jgi:hypothetical protein
MTIGHIGNFIMKRVSILAVVAGLANASVGAQTAQPAHDTQTASENVTPQKTSQNEGAYSASTNSEKEKKKGKKKIRRDSKPAPTKEEEEFDKVLLGTFGGLH